METLESKGQRINVNVWGDWSINQSKFIYKIDEQKDNQSTLYFL